MIQKIFLGRIFLIIFIGFFGFLGNSFLVSNTNAEEDIFSDGKNADFPTTPQMVFSPCEEIFLEAFAERDVEFFSQLDQMYSDKSTNITAKINASSGFLKTYECQGRFICQSVLNGKPMEIAESFDCINAKPDFVAKLFPKDTDWEKCSPLTGSNVNILESCENFAKIKTDIAEKRFSKKTIEVSGEQNNGFLGAKILDIQKKMQVLMEKVRVLTIDMNKILTDINCTLP